MKVTSGHPQVGSRLGVRVRIPRSSLLSIPQMPWTSEVVPQGLIKSKHTIVALFGTSTWTCRILKLGFYGKFAVFVETKTISFRTHSPSQARRSSCHVRANHVPDTCIFSVVVLKSTYSIIFTTIMGCQCSLSPCQSSCPTALYCIHRAPALSNWKGLNPCNIPIL